MSRTSTAATALSMALAMTLPSVAIAQSAAPGEPTLQTITVVAPRITYEIRRERGSAVPVKVEIAKKDAVVNYADLDLTRTADLYTLEERVHTAAARVCDDLAREFPEGEPAAAVCARRASDDAMAQVRVRARMSARASGQ